MTSRERILAMLDGKSVDHLPLMPITMMFAADQLGVKYGRYAADHRLMVDAQLLTAERFDIDHVSTISDPGREAADLGAKVEFYDDQPPAIDENGALLADKTTLARLKSADPLGGGRMHDRVKGIALLKEKVGKDKLVEGWVEGPCSEAADLRGINTLMTDFFDDPVFVRDLFEFVVENGLRFCKAQVEAGVDMIGMGDTAASLVGPKIYYDFVWPYEKRMIEGMHALGARVRLHICGNTRKILEGMGRVGADLIDLDWLSPLSEGREKMGPHQTLLGNIDPVRLLRNTNAESVTSAIAQCHLDAGTRYIVGAGCEVVRDTPAAHMYALRDYARSH
jgi:MtaA/CmuA family methyltransferase